MKTKRNHVFVSYSHKDRKWLNRLKVHLRPLVREGDVDLWDDSRIQPGSNWRSEIQQAIDKASVAVLLISADFLASDFVHENELPPLLEKAKNEGASIIPIIVSPCRFIETKNISQFQAVNDASQPLTSQSETKQEKVFLELSKHIEKAFSEIGLSEIENKVRNSSGEREIAAENFPVPSAENSYKTFTHISHISQSVISKIMELAKSENPLTGISTGYRELDYLTSGFQPSELILVAAKPYMGLSAFGLSIALNVAILENRTVAFFSMELAKQKIVLQMICAEARVDVERLSTGYLTREEWGRVAHAHQTLEESAIFISDGNEFSVQEMQVELRKILKEQKNLNLIIVDNLQHIVSPQKTEVRHSEASQLPLELKGLAKEFKVPIMVLCQLPSSDGISYQNRPTLFDLRKVGSIEQFADVSILIHREDFYRPTEENAGIAEIIVMKDHAGLTRTFKLAFLREFNRFENYFEKEV